tara:strand:- start:391 stop:582 length:192 start_codon:yes stop_codon:yes gene_type:complete
MNELLKNAVDPMGLLSEPTSEEIKEWEKSPHLSDNPYTLIGFVVNYRKNKMIEEFNKAINEND